MRAARLALWLLLSQLLLAACGGRLVNTEGDDDGTGASSNGQGASTGSGARPGRAGSTGTGTGATTSQGGASTGTAGSIAVGGAVSTAGTTASGGGCNCPMLACPPGTQPVPNRNGCCYTCQAVAVCPDIPCAPIACGPGSHLEILPGQCCPTCVADKCEDQRIAYIRLREQLLEKYRTLGCMTHQDCGVYVEKNACEIGCGLVVPTAAFEFLEQNLTSFAAQTCTPECPPQPLPCEPPGDPFCVNGSCQ